MMRVGWGVDVHPFGGTHPLVLGGHLIDDDVLVSATSDGDVASHAVTDAMLGAAGLGDIGMHFPSSDERWHGAPSTEMLRTAVAKAAEVGVFPEYVDVTVLLQWVRIAPHRDQIRAGLAEALGLSVDRVSVKATTTDGLGFVGRDEGIAATAVLTARVEA